MRMVRSRQHCNGFCNGSGVTRGNYQCFSPSAQLTTTFIGVVVSRTGSRKMNLLPSPVTLYSPWLGFTATRTRKSTCGVLVSSVAPVRTSIASTLPSHFDYWPPALCSRSSAEPRLVLPDSLGHFQLGEWFP